MAVCLDYQAVYCRKNPIAFSLRAHVIAATLLLAALVGKIWLKLECTELGYSLARMREEAKVLDDERRELELQRSVLLRPDHLAERAHARLGLEQLRPERARRVVY